MENKRRRLTGFGDTPPSSVRPPVIVLSAQQIWCSREEEWVRGTGKFVKDARQIVYLRE
jgi:hypothetical protein